MSHIVQLQVKIKYPELFKAVAADCGLEGVRVEENANVRFYSRQNVRGLAVHLPGWRYPVVVDDQGTVHYDNFNGAWGKQEYLNLLVQQYVTAVVMAQAQAAGRPVNAQELEDGTVILRVAMKERA